MVPFSGGFSPEFFFLLLPLLLSDLSVVIVGVFGPLLFLPIGVMYLVKDTWVTCIGLTVSMFLSLGFTTRDILSINLIQHHYFMLILVDWWIF